MRQELRAEEAKRAATPETRAAKETTKEGSDA